MSEANTSMQILRDRDVLLVALYKVATDMVRKDFKSESDRCEYVRQYVEAAIAKATS